MSGPPSRSLPEPLDPPVAARLARVRDSFARQGAMTLVGATLVDIQPGYCAIGLVPRPEIWWLSSRSVTSRGSGVLRCSSEICQAQPAAITTTATPASEASQMRR